MPHEELEYTIKMNQRAIEAQQQKLQKNMAALQTLIESNDYHGYNSMVWLEGHVAEDIANMSSLIARQRALVDALHIVKKNS
jgi:hypothetical protein